MNGRQSAESPAARVRELCGRPRERVGGQRVRVHAPETSMSVSLSLHVNRHVSPSVFWNDYPDAAAFSSANPSSWRRSGDRMEPIETKHLSIDLSTGVATATPRDDAAQSVNPDERPSDC